MMFYLVFLATKNLFQVFQFSPFPLRVSQLSSRVFQLQSANALAHPVKTETKT